MPVKDIFLKLTSTTMPHGNEKLAEPYLPKGWKNDKHGNYYYVIGKSDPSVMFTCHLDTADHGQPKKVEHVIEGKIVKTDGKTILGADDKAGAAMMVYMIEKGFPGMYYFFIGEETGCIGSRALKGYLQSNKEDELYKNITKVVSLDRRDDNSIITFQCGERCCSDEFADDLAKQLNSAGGFKYVKDQGGLVTDSHHLADIIPECTNLSVGYDDQHSVREKQDIEFLQKLTDACMKVDWESLPIKRDPTKIERRSYYSSSRSYSGYEEWETGQWWKNRDSASQQSWNRSSSGGPGQLSPNTEFVTDYLGNRIRVTDAQWCEYDKQWCLKSEAIWEEYIGFWICPDFDPTKVKKEEHVSNNFSSITEKDVKVGAIVYSENNEEFGHITEVGEKVHVSGEGNSRFILPMEKFLNYGFKIKKETTENASGSGKRLTTNDVKKDLNIIHPSFGKGKIIGIRPDNQIVKIYFNDKGEKDIRVDVANMTF